MFMAKQKKRRSSPKASGKEAFSLQSPLRTYKHLEKEIEKTWLELRKEIKKKNHAAIEKRKDDLLLLLGECNYMAQECTRCLKSNPN